MPKYVKFLGILMDEDLPYKYHIQEFSKCYLKPLESSSKSDISSQQKFSVLILFSFLFLA